ncbi:uncharacterized protein MONBRDRAFT_34505 [Monosiga brevicollis MX1]|uniref:SH3 domain-containing protein n=1 Tax=Monosiga brevicollis TaxID=81824 RepID=A9VC52_MONBE|nr:uncharacterized protein MONBRDRAFT_34505 [Monosiga brevicollis MX1]EDQ84922.1 predicted protein [Monosiga brevicollis MX1]|eukprot:XP_001750263.1 hypothetical protein [Monosiga brevicollis MX1]
MASDRKGILSKAKKQLERQSEKLRQKLGHKDDADDVYADMVANFNRQQANDAYDEARKSFEFIDRECHEALPSLYDQRIPFYSATLESHCNTTAIFYGACQSALEQLQLFCSHILSPDTSNEASSTPASANRNAIAAETAAVELPRNALELRVVTHNYEATGDDELNLTRGDQVVVLPFPDPEDAEDEGWLFGRLGECEGMFPENHTQKIDSAA